MKQKTLQKKVQDNLKTGEDFLDFLSEEIQKSSLIKVGLTSLFASGFERRAKTLQ